MLEKRHRLSSWLADDLDKARRSEKVFANTCGEKERKLMKWAFEEKQLEAF